MPLWRVNRALRAGKSTHALLREEAWGEVLFLGWLVLVGFAPDWGREDSIWRDQTTISIGGPFGWTDLPFDADDEYLMLEAKVVPILFPVLSI